MPTSSPTPIPRCAVPCLRRCRHTDTHAAPASIAAIGPSEMRVSIAAEAATHAAASVLGVGPRRRSRASTYQLAPATAKPAPSLRPPLPTAMRLGTTAVRQVAAKPTPRRALQRSPDDRDALLGTEVVAELGKPTVDHRGDVEEVGALVAADEQGLTQGEVRAEAEADQGGREQQENRGEPRPTAAPRRPVSGGGSLEYQASVTGRCHPDAMPGNPEPAGQGERKASTIAARHARRLGLWWSSGDRPRRTTIRSRGGHSISD